MVEERQRRHRPIATNTVQPPHVGQSSGSRRAVGEGAFAPASASKAQGIARAMERASGTRAARYHGAADKHDSTLQGATALPEGL